MQELNSMKWLDTLRAECTRTSQREVADVLGVSNATISLLLNGKYAHSTDRIASLVRQRLAVPNWMVALRTECAASTQAIVAGKLGISEATVSQVLSGTYKASTMRIERRIRGEFIGETVDCPVMGNVSMHLCQDMQERKDTGSSDQWTMQCYGACRGLGRHYEKHGACEHYNGQGGTPRAATRPPTKRTPEKAAQMELDKADVARRLREDRERLGLSEGDLDAAGGSKYNDHFTYERGEVIPNAVYLAGIARAGIDVQFVLTGRRADEEHVHSADCYVEGTQVCSAFEVPDDPTAAELDLLMTGIAMSPTRDKKVALLDACRRYFSAPVRKETMWKGPRLEMITCLTTKAKIHAVVEEAKRDNLSYEQYKEKIDAIHVQHSQELAIPSGSLP